MAFSGKLRARFNSNGFGFNYTMHNLTLTPEIFDMRGQANC